MKCQLFVDDSAKNRKHLLEEALKVAKHGKVLYIMYEELTELPELFKNVNTNRHYMKMITFLYVKSVDSLLESLSGLQHWQSVPLAIILEDLNQFCNKDNLHQASGIVAFLIDTARACSMKQECIIFVAVDKNVVGSEYCNTLNELYFTQV